MTDYTRKLWVDDIRTVPSEDWLVAKTVTSAIRAINMFFFDEISLDHDISHQVTVGTLGRPYPCEECFCAVAYYVAAKYADKPIKLVPKITIHTSNPTGAEDMQAILKEAGIKSTIKMMGFANRLEQEA